MAIAERYADGLVGEPERFEALCLANASRDGIRKNQYRNEEFWRVAPMVARLAIWATGENLREPHSPVLEMPEVRPLLRDVFGNPFRPATVSAAWLAWNGGTVPRLAQGIYDERAFERMPVLADALEEAGCTDADVLEHCRRQEVHVRGCWLLDALLGKEP